MAEKCKLCNRTFNHQYNLFGRGCLNYEYKLLGITKPKKVKNQELYLCNEIAKRLQKRKLNREQKYELTQRYLTIQYLDKINYGNLDKEKEQLWEQIKNSPILSRVSIPPITLNSAYNLYKITNKFDIRLKEFEKSSNDKKSMDDIKEKDFLNSMKFIFDLTKITMPATYNVYYAMQYAFWNIVVIGGYFTNMNLSAKLMRNSLSSKPKDITITDKTTINQIEDNEAFKAKLKYITEKYGKGKTSFIFTERNNKEDANIEFNNNYDLFLSIHGGTIRIKGIKDKEGHWDLDINITDTYDFTDWKNKDEIYISHNEGESDAKKLNELANILNNFGVISMKYGVLKEFEVSVNIKYKY